MIDSGGGGIGKAEQLLQELHKTQASQNAAADQGPRAPSEAFRSALARTQQAQAATVVQVIQPAHVTRAHGVLLQARATALSPSTRVAEAAQAQRSRMAQMLDGLIGGQDKMTQIMSLALSGRQFSSQELLALQAGVYRFSQELDLTGKVIEKATSGIKQTMNTQV